MNDLTVVEKIAERQRLKALVLDSVMLTEGWDANTVAHILGVHAFERNFSANR